MRRRWVVRPRPGEIEIHREDMATALMDAEAIIARCGGHLSVITERVRSEDVFADGLPGEAFTTAAIFEWKDRTDARPQPESTVTAAPEPELFHEPEVSVPVDEDNPDGLIVQDEPDLAAVPAHAR